MTSIFLKATTKSIPVDITEGLGSVEREFIWRNSNSRAIPVMQSQEIQVVVATQNGDAQGNA